MSDKNYKLVARYAYTLANGLPIGPGQVVALDDDARKANKRLIDRGVLLEVPPEKKTKSTQEGGES